MYNKILESEVISVDCESTGLKVRSDKVIGFSVSDGINSTYITHLQWNGVELIEHTTFNDCVVLLKMLIGKKIIGHNFAFDSQIINNYFGVNLLDSLYVDTMLLIHTCDENMEQYGLKYLGEKLLDIRSNEQYVLKAELKKLNTKDFYKIPHHIMAPYARQDAVLTYRLFEYGIKLVNKELFFDEIMPLYKSVIRMQAYGIKLDLDALNKDLISITKDIQTLEQSIQRQLAPHLTEFKDWFYEREFPFKTRGKMVSLKKANPHLSDRMVQMLAFKEGGGTYEFNLSSDMHLRKLFFEKLKCTPLSTTDGGLPRADMNFLQSIESTHSFTSDMIILGKLQKIKSTYIERFLEEQEGGIFYATYFLHRTTSGRLSGDFQQLPRALESGSPILLRYTNAIRKYFVARPGKVIIANDYNSLEPRIFAALAGDKDLLDIFRNGEDFYSKIYLSVFPATKASALKSADDFLGKVNKPARQQSKSFSLGIRYGLNDFKLHHDLKISQKEAKEIVDNYFKAFPKLKQSMDAAKKSILEVGVVSTQFGRCRRNYDVPELYKKYGEIILDPLELYSHFMQGDGPRPIEYAIAKNAYKTVRHALNNAYNFEIQATAAHVTNRAMIKLDKALTDGGYNARIIIQCHDEICIEADEKDKEEVIKIMQDIMENTTKFEIPLTAEPSCGYNYADAKG